MTASTPTPEAVAKAKAAITEVERYWLGWQGGPDIGSTLAHAITLRDALTASEARVKELEAELSDANKAAVGLSHDVSDLGARNLDLEAEVKGMREAWNPPDHAPPINIGADRYFIVAVRRKNNGNVWTFPAIYIREFTLTYPDEPYERPVTGWFTVESTDDDALNYRELLHDGDELVGWREIEPHPLQARAALDGKAVGG